MKPTAACRGKASRRGALVEAYVEWIVEFDAWNRFFEHDERWDEPKRDEAASSASNALVKSALVGDLAELESVLAAHPWLDLDACDRNFSIALHEACSHGHFECAKLLLSKGAKATVLDNSGYAALDCVAIADLQKGSASAMARLLMEHGALLDGAGPHGLTPFLLACRSASAGAAQAFLELGADIWARTPDRRSAYDVAVSGRYYHGSVFSLHGMRIKAREAVKNTFIDWLCSACERAEFLEELAMGASEPQPRVKVKSI